MRRPIRLIAIVLLLVAGATRGASPDAEPRTTLVRITLSDDCYQNDSIKVVLDGNESEIWALKKRDMAGTGTWTFSWKDRRKRKFPGNPLSASLRLGGRRTYCRTAVEGPERGGKGESVAVFEFRCDKQEAVALKVVTVAKDTQPFKISYYRWLPKDPSPKSDDLDCSCREQGDNAGTVDLFDVRIPEELVFFELRADRGAVGVALFPPGARAPGIFLRRTGPKGVLRMDPAIRRYANPIDPGVRLGPKGVATIQLFQRALPGADFSGLAIDIDQKLLKNLETVDFTVPR